MNQTESRLTDELRAEAARVDVDVDRMWSAVQGRTVEPSPSVRRPWGRVLAPYAAAAAVAAVLVAVAVNLSGNDGTTATPGPTSEPGTAVKPSQPVGGPVDGAIGDWACPYRTVVNPGIDMFSGSPPPFKPVRVLLDPSVVPAEALGYGVPRYNFSLSGAKGVLDYGDSAGQRISRTELTKTAKGWLVVRRTVCSGQGGKPSPDPVKLGTYTPKPLAFNKNAAQVKATPITGTPVLLDDRSYYDGTGMLRQTTLYAFPVKGGYQFARVPAEDGSFDSSVIPEGRIAGDAGVPITGAGPEAIFADYTLSVGWVFSYLTRDADVTGIGVKHPSNDSAGPAQRFTFPGGRTLYTAVPTSRQDGDALVTVHRKSGDEAPARF